VIEIVAAVRLRREITGEVWLALAGLISIAFGTLLIARPGAGILTLLWILAVYAVAFGAMLIALAFEVRSVGRRITMGRRTRAA
jgi:uncharacterized membrane protein HdeD (DUF308 family)